MLSRLVLTSYIRTALSPILEENVVHGSLALRLLHLGEHEERLREAERLRVALTQVGVTLKGLV